MRFRRKLCYMIVTVLLLSAFNYAIFGQERYSRSRRSVDSQGWRDEIDALNDRVTDAETLIADLTLALDAEKAKVVKLKAGQLNLTGWEYASVNARKIEATGLPTGRLLWISYVDEPTGERQVSKTDYDTLAAENLATMQAQIDWLRTP